MDRIFESGAAVGAPSPPGTPSVGYPTAGNPQGGAAPTKPGAYWFYQITEELRSVIVAAGITPDHEDVGQLAEAVVALITAGLETGLRADQVNVFTAAQRGAVVALADGPTITPNFSLANNYSVTLAGNRTLAAPSNLVAGQSGIITIKQDATGSRTLAFASAWKFAGGVAPSLTTAANSMDALVYCTNPDGTTIFASLAKDVK